MLRAVELPRRGPVVDDHDDPGCERGGHIGDPSVQREAQLRPLSFRERDALRGERVEPGRDRRGGRRQEELRERPIRRDTDMDLEGPPVADLHGVDGQRIEELVRDDGTGEQRGHRR